MNTPSITFRNIPFSDSLNTKILRKIVKLEHHFPFIVSCRVIIDAPHHHNHKGYLYRFNIHVQVPGRVLSTTRVSQNHRHENAHATLNDAFHTVHRQLVDYGQQKRKDIKVHAKPPHGRVFQLHDQFGVILTRDNEEIYFHANSLLKEDFKNLSIGKEVRFVLNQGEQGPQASSVRLIGKHHIV